LKKETLLYEKLANDQVRCHICQRRCKISPGKFGYCFTRINEEGRLYSLIYGEVSTWRVAPAEIKPLFHFYPGSHALSLGSLGCNFRCLGCQNWDIAHFRPVLYRRFSEGKIKSNELWELNPEYISPEQSVKMAKKYNCQGLSWTYNEPTLWFEYTLDSAILAKKEGLYTNYVTNGFITEEALDLIGPHLDAFRVDIKGFSEKYYKPIANVRNYRGILEVAERAKKRWKMHVEVITNIIPGYNDDEEQLKGISLWIYDSLGKDTPWHVTRFVPHLKLSHLPYTPLATLERVYQIGKESGLLFVYLGNVPGHPYENTYCPRCSKLLIKRYNYQILSYEIQDGRCKFCGEKIPIRTKSPLPTLGEGKGYIQYCD